MKTKSILFLLLIGNDCKCNDPGIFVFVSVLILAMIQDQALVASKHYLVETEDKNLADNAVDPPLDDAESGQTEHGDDYGDDGNGNGNDYWMGKK